MALEGLGIRVSGLASGIDTEGIIARILSLERRPIQRLQIQQTGLQTRRAALDQYKSLLNALRAATAELNSSSSFSAVAATSSSPEVATVTASAGARPGVYNLAVTRLAQAHKVGTSAQSSSSDALGLSGSFLVNGKLVVVTSSDSLTSIASKINAVQSGVTASIINGGSGNAFLTLTAKNSGAQNAIALSDVGTDVVLQSLGFVSGATAIRRPITNGAESLGFADSVSPVGSLLGISVPAGDIVINGVAINVDFASDSLASIAGKINASGANVTASVVSAVENGATVYKLAVTGAAVPTFGDANNMLQSLGILQRGFGNQLLAAQDAAFSLDGISFTSANNVVSDIIPGATITLLKANAAPPETTRITLSMDTAGIKSKVQGLATAYNAVVDFLKVSASFDKESLESGPLFGDSTVDMIQSRLFMGLLASPAGVSGPYGNLLAIGVDFDASGKMSVDAAKFEAAVGTHLDNVRALFSEMGTINDLNVRFVSATARTRPSGLTGYEVVITQLATQASVTAATSFTQATSQEEILTFNGDLFGNVEYRLIIGVGKTLDDVISQVNNDARLKDKITASKSGNRLVLTSKEYGTPGNFSVVSNLGAASNNTGIGTTVMHGTGLDVGGTIKGEPATGRGQFLTGNAENANTSGLRLLITGGPVGSRGILVYSKGAATVLANALDEALDFVSGHVPTAVSTLQAQIDDMSSRITGLEQALIRKEEQLRLRFRLMEEAVSRLQAQMARMDSILAGLNRR